VILFGIPDRKDDVGSEGWDDTAAVQETVRRLKDSVPDLVVMTDVCLDEYTSHGHCGIVKNGDVDNDATLPLLAQIAVSHARAGADVVAPSDMMDGRVAAIRRTLDAEGFASVAILAYSAKSASAFYGPFREAADSAPKFGDRRGYQMDFRNRHDAIREALLDEEEGADVLMVKPGIAYLDIVRDLRERTHLPLAAYQVSGEYSMIRYAAQAGAIDERAVVRELWHAFRRAGANYVLTYHAAMAVRQNWFTA
jgi:porphobilinogen synthase